MAIETQTIEIESDIKEIDRHMDLVFRLADQRFLSERIWHAASLAQNMISREIDTPILQMQIVGEEVSDRAMQMTQLDRLIPTAILRSKVFGCEVHQDTIYAFNCLTCVLAEARRTNQWNYEIDRIITYGN